MGALLSHLSVPVLQVLIGDLSRNIETLLSIDIILPICMHGLQSSKKDAMSQNNLILQYPKNLKVKVIHFTNFVDFSVQVGIVSIHGKSIC